MKNKATNEWKKKLDKHYFYLVRLSNSFEGKSKEDKERIAQSILDLRMICDTIEWKLEEEKDVIQIVRLV